MHHSKLPSIAALGCLTLAIACSGASVDHPEQTGAATSSDSTIVYTLNIDANHLIQFHQYADGSTAVAEQGRTDVVPVVPTLHLTPGAISLAEVFSKVRPTES